MIQRNSIRSFFYTVAFVLMAIIWTESAHAQTAIGDRTTANAEQPTGELLAPLAVAQALTPTSTPTPRPTLSAPIGLISPTLTITATTQPGAASSAENNGDDESPIPRTTVVTTQPIPGLRPTPTPQATEPDEVDEDVVEAAAEVAAAEVAPLVGTILTNRSTYAARFFVEGTTLELAPGQATSFDLARATSVLNLYNCAATTPESNTDCFWDPYILQRDGFFEIYQSRPAGATVVARLMVRAADAPPLDQVWIQNRTANAESIVFRNEVIELAPAAMEEFAVAPGFPAIVYVRSCLAIQGQMACEWSPKSLDAGIYYAMTEVEVAGALPNSAIINIDLRPVVGGGEETVEAAAATNDITCRVLVPALNIRSGPGLQYEIIGKIFSSEAEPGEVRVVGRNADSQWVVVDPVVLPDGWVTATETFITCQGDKSTLPVVEAPPLPVQPVPAPVVVAPQPDAPSTESGAPDSGQSQADAPDDESADETVEALPSDAPDGYSVLMLHNGFEHPIRFTIDQQYRPETGPSEIDLAPGQSQRVVVFPGRITFSASTPWGGGLSGNALINIDANETQPLWLRFVTDTPGGSSSSWRLIWD